MGITQNLNKILSEIPEQVKLVAVSKTHPVNSILEAYQAGQRVFGENRPQELVQKYQQLPTDIEWHFIGNLQTNKVKYIAPFVSLIHSVDSLKLLQVIDKEAKKNNRIIDCLLEFHIANEMSKSGLTMDEAHEILNSQEFKNLTHIKIVGVMGMATFTDNVKQIRGEFCNLHDIYIKLKQTYFNHHPEFKEISMGMSGDYELAISCGSTLIRIGTAIFGGR
jgi:hypothetical protein